MNGILPILNTQRINTNKQISNKNAGFPAMHDCVSFRGLNRTLSKKAYETASMVKQEGAKHAKSKGIIGNLPHEWIQKIPKEEREVKIKELYNSFKEIIKKLRITLTQEQISKELNDALHKAGVINKNETLDMHYINDGERGIAFLLHGVSKDNYLMKIFHSDNFTEIAKTVDVNLGHVHGNFIEPNRAAYWQKNAGKSQKVKFNFGDIDSAYMVEKYIGPDTPEYKGRIVKEKYLGLYNSDTYFENEIKGYQIEYGGLEVSSKALSSNKTARYVYKKLDKMPENQRVAEFSKFLGMKKFRNNKDIKLGLAESLELMPESQRSICYKELLESNDNRVKETLAKNLFLSFYKDRFICFKKILNNADNQVKLALVNCLGYISKAQRLEILDELLNGTDNTVKKALINNLDKFPEEKLPQIVGDLYKTGDDKLKKYIYEKAEEYCVSN